MASRSKLFTYLTKRTIYIVIVILIILGVVIGTFIIQARRQANSQVLVDTFGLQRTYVQSMTKDANRIFNTLSLMENPETDLSVLENELTETKSNLEETIGKYEGTISSLEQGYLNTQYGRIAIYERNLEVLENALDENRAVWNEIRPEYENMLLVEPSENRDNSSLLFINENADNLMEQTERLSSLFLNENQQIYSGNMNRVLIFIVSLAILLVYAMYEFYKYLFLPLDQFYTGFKEIGLVTVSTRRHKGLRSVSDEIARMLGGVIKSMNLIEDINTNMSFEESLDHIYKSFAMYIPYSHIGIALFKDKESDVLVGSYGIGDGKIDKEMTGIIGYEAKVSDTSLEKIMHSKKPRIINDLDIYFRDRPVKSYNQIISNAGIKSSITMPLIANDDCIGFIFFSSPNKNAYNEEHIKFLKIISNSISISFQKKYIYRRSPVCKFNRTY
jgi:GAF domain-containing protein